MLKAIQDIECYILGSIILKNSLFYSIEITITSDHFTFYINRSIWDIINKLISTQKEITINTIYDQVRLEHIPKCDLPYISSLIDYVDYPSELELTTRVDTLDQYYRKALMRKIGENMIKEADDSASDANVMQSKFETMILNMRNKRYSTEFTPIHDDVDKLNVKIKDIMEGKLSYGLNTGYSSIDNILKGMVSGSYIVIGARPSVGKTAFALNILTNLAKQGIFVGLFSVEMSKEEIQLRVISGMSEIPYEHIKTGNIQPDYP